MRELVQLVAKVILITLVIPVLVNTNRKDPQLVEYFI